MCGPAVSAASSSAGAVVRYSQSNADASNLKIMSHKSVGGLRSLSPECISMQHSEYVRPLWSSSSRPAPLPRAMSP